MSCRVYNERMDEIYPILEFDPNPHAFIEPRHIQAAMDVPECAVICFFGDVVQSLVEKHDAKLLRELRSEIGRNPVYEIELNGRRLAVFQPGVGAPLAAGFMEEVIALGCTKFIACGACGVLDSTIAVGHVLVPTSAVRDEGTSYHYLPAAREVEVSPGTVAAIENVLQQRDIEYLLTKTWTTDAFFRETPERVARRRAEGCLCVEMEVSALCAVAKFRGVEFGQLLFGGDDLGGEVWDSRGWVTRRSARENLFWLAAEACLAL